jgi:hypothetical protein
MGGFTPTMGGFAGFHHLPGETASRMTAVARLLSMLDFPPRFGSNVR